MNYDNNLHRTEKYYNDEYRFTKAKEINNHNNKSSFHTINPYENKSKKQVNVQFPQDSVASNDINDFGEYLKGYYQEVIQQNEALKHKIDLCESSIKYLNEKMKTKDSENIELKEQSQNKSKKIQELKSQNLQLNKKYKQLKISYKTLVTDFKLVEQRQTKERDLRIQIQSEKNYLVERYQNYEGELQKYQQENEHLRRRLKQLQDDNMEEEKQIKSFKKQLEIKQKQIQQLKKNNEKFKETNTFNNQKCELLIQNNNNLEQVIANLQQEKSDLINELQANKIEKVNILNQKKDITEHIQTNFKKYSQINQKYIQAISEKENLCSLNDRFEEVLKKSSQEKFQLEAEIKTLRNLLKNNDKKQNENYFSNINTNGRKTVQIVDSESDFETKRELFKDKSDRKVGKIKNRSKQLDELKHQQSIRLVKNKSKEIFKNNSRNESKNLDTPSNGQLQKLIQKFEKIKANRSLKR